ncbi:MAG TPA: hypothetical protein VFQ57_05640 [Sphingomonas sp.]|jgi:hypothetical protein|nr:hypothetical protein [Sphingomonas sp.]
MSVELLEALASLSSIINEENDRLVRPIRHPDLPALVEAKLRLTGQVEAESSRLMREDPDWMDALAPELRDGLRLGFETLIRRLEVNGRLLERRIALCDEIVGAITAEAQRLSGACSAVYGVHGTLKATRMPAPISVNSQF